MRRTVHRLLWFVPFICIGVSALEARPYPFILIVPPEMQKYFVSFSPVPEVPYELRRNHWSGRGVFRVFIDADGTVTGATVVQSTGYRVVDESFTAAIRKWRARPGKKREIDFPLAFQAPPRGMPSPGL